MRQEIEQEIRKECHKHIARYMAKLRTANRDQDRFEARTGEHPLPAGVPLPEHWALDQQFDPFYVRSHIKSIAFSITRKIKSMQYEPKPAVRLQIPKPRGGSREISVFTVVDSAVSTWLHGKLLARNYPAFSGYSYAYRSDRSGHPAIEHLAKTMDSTQRAYILEYDFKRYFDSIGPKYLIGVITKNVKRSPREHALTEAFLRYQFANGIASYKQGEFACSTLGFPQGTTISLFFANVACLELDRQIEQTGATFARFADDTVIICDDYGVANGLARIMLNHGVRSGAGINKKKSEGMSQVGERDLTELKKATESFVFLGHRISTTSVSVAPHTVRRLKREMATIIYNNLLLYPKRGKFNQVRIKRGIDLDLVDCIDELRRSLYGDLSSDYVSQALTNLTPLKLSTSKLSYYALVSDAREFVGLDGWLADALSRAYNYRRGLLGILGHTLPKVRKAALVNGSWYSKAKNHPNPLPSFTKSWRYARKCYLAFGTKLCPPPPQYDA
jgi:RNA-directed DNA polymerase